MNAITLVAFSKQWHCVTGFIVTMGQITNEDVSKLVAGGVYV